ncbi:MAG TPA: RES family NAD+ phosphorylase [Thermoanaerobaculia bacterium]|nr:RES family NAD+ phosphorylase [Thermoanaerobaculia bacterium]
MSPTTWTLSAVTAELRTLQGRPWRVVEAQHVVSTRKLVDTAAEQALLEELLERAKPPLPPEPEAVRAPRRARATRLHYLLVTPFRYPPLRHGSRFGTRAERGIWYGADALPTALAEVAYYRLVFLEGTEADLEPILVDLSAFRVRVRTRAGVDLRRPPFSAHEAEVSSPVSYAASQALGRVLREAGVEAFRYRSARDVGGGANIALFTPAAFAAREPEPPETWYCVATRAAVELTRRALSRPNVAKGSTYRFPREVFEVEGALPTPAV